MNAIVSVTSDWGIGHEGKLLVRNRDDMRRFVRLTSGGTVLMGRTTFESFPDGPLKGRRNVVVTSQEDYGQSHPGIECASSLEDALSLVASDDPERTWLIGGAQLYRQLIDWCERAYVTRHDIVVPADAYFPNLDEMPAWEVESIEDGGATAEGVPFSYVTYRRVSA